MLQTSGAFYPSSRESPGIDGNPFLWTMFMAYGGVAVMYLFFLLLWGTDATQSLKTLDVCCTCSCVLALLPLLAAAIFMHGWVFREAVSPYRAYEAAALHRPVITNAATSGVAYFIGDLIGQAFAVPRGLSHGRLLRSTFFGTFVHGPQLHYMSMSLDRFCSFHGARWALLLKILIDQTLITGYLNAAYCMTMELLQGCGFQCAWRTVRDTAWECLLAAWRFWPLAHVLTYGVVPLHLRVLWVDVLGIAWVAYLSILVARAQAPADPAPSPAAGTLVDQPGREEQRRLLEPA